MSAAVGGVSSTTKESVSYTPPHLEEDSDAPNNSDDAIDETETEDDDDSRLESDRELDLGPQFTLKEQLEKDKACFLFFLPFHCIAFQLLFFIY